MYTGKDDLDRKSHLVVGPGIPIWIDDRAGAEPQAYVTYTSRLGLDDDVGHDADIRPGSAIELNPEQFVRTLRVSLTGALPANASLLKLQDLQGDGGQRPQIGLE